MCNQTKPDTPLKPNTTQPRHPSNTTTQSFLDEKEVADRVLSVVKNFEKVCASLLAFSLLCVCVCAAGEKKQRRTRHGKGVRLCRQITHMPFFGLTAQS